LLPVLASTPAALALTLLAAVPDVTQVPPLPDCQALQERVDLSPEPEGKAHELCISPGIVTTWLFEDSLPPGAVHLEVEAKDVMLVQVGRVVTLLPSERLIPGQRVNMTVRFDDGAAPASASFVLVVHPARAQRQVEVFRQKRTMASYQQALQAREAEAQQCHEQNAQLRAAQGRPDGLRGLRGAGLMGQGGVAFRKLNRGVTTRPGSVLKAPVATSYRASARVAVEVQLTLLAPVGTEPWEAEGAVLIGPGGRELPVLGVWQEAPVTLGEEGEHFVMVEAEAKPEEAQGTFTLKLWGKGGMSPLTLDGVRFPPLQMSASPRD
jgi:uncharacterized protein (TIGR02268 family)